MKFSSQLPRITSPSCRNDLRRVLALHLYEAAEPFGYPIYDGFGYLIPRHHLIEHLLCREPIHQDGVINDFPFAARVAAALRHLE